MSCCVWTWLEGLVQKMGRLQLCNESMTKVYLGKWGEFRHPKVTRVVPTISWGHLFPCVHSQALGDRTTEFEAGDRFMLTAVRSYFFNSRLLPGPDANSKTIENLAVLWTPQSSGSEPVCYTTFGCCMSGIYIGIYNSTISTIRKKQQNVLVGVLTTWGLQR